MFEVHQYFSWYIIARPDDNGKMWYVSHIRRTGYPEFTRDPLYARHFTRKVANQLVSEFNSYVEAPNYIPTWTCIPAD